MSDRYDDWQQVMSREDFEDIEGMFLGPLAEYVGDAEDQALSPSLTQGHEPRQGLLGAHNHPVWQPPAQDPLEQLYDANVKFDQVASAGGASGYRLLITDDFKRLMLDAMEHWLDHECAAGGEFLDLFVGRIFGELDER